MASNKDSKTSKTAHVMNLLSKNRNAEPAPAAESPAPQSSAPAPAAPAAPPIPPIISSINADAAVASQIKDALEAALVSEESPAQPAVQTPHRHLRQCAGRPSEESPAQPAVQTPPPAAPLPVQPASPPVAEEEPAPQQPAPPPAEDSAIPAATAETRDCAGYERPAYVNVMEVLVREKAEKYMRASGTCCCDQCMVDVMAYTLNHLPPKYVVMSKGEMIPKLTFYEVQHSSDITARLMQACDVVAKSPHHGRL